MNALLPLISVEEYRFVLRNDPMSFFHRAFYELNPQTPFIPGPHVEMIASRLEACRRGEIRRLIINLPPRALKSHCVSIAFPAYLLGHNPAEQIICASYGQDLAEKLARDTRAIMYSPFYQSTFPTRIDGHSLHDFSTTQGGYRMATSIGGVLTGRGGNFIIIDDPQKPDEALSETQRVRANEWFSNSLVSRLNNKNTGCIIIVMQRLHQDDLVGHVLENNDWEVLSFPAIAETEEDHLIETPFGARRFLRLPGEALHPERETLETLMKIKRDVGEYNFAGQYQQNPTPPGGAMVKKDWLKYYEPGSEPAKFVRIIQSWDTANKVGELNSYSVCTTWGQHGKDFYLLNVYRKRLNYPDLKRAVIERKQHYRAHTVLIEDKASGTQLIQDLKRDGVLIKAYLPPPGNDKTMRLHAQTIYFENGRIFLPQTASWLEEYVAELTGFPGTQFADQVDSTTQFLDYVSSCPPPMVFSPELLRRAAEPRRNLLQPMPRMPPYFF